MSRPIYLDYAATTPVDPRVAALMAECLSLEGDFGNPASNTHAYGFRAKERVETAREQIAHSLGVLDSREIIFTSGATESNNLALQGFFKNYLNTNKNTNSNYLITMLTEHKAVLDPAKYLSTQGVNLIYLKPETNPESQGLLSLEKLEQALKNITQKNITQKNMIQEHKNNNPKILISIMWVNNETGVIQDILKIAELVKSYGAYLHVDAAQAAGKLEINLSQIPVDLLSISAHKFYGPKGIGVLYVRRKPKVNLSPIIYGGGHEMGFRSGTLPTHQIAGMGLALYLSHENLAQESDRILKLKNKFWSGLTQNLDKLKINGIKNIENKNLVIPNILNICFEGVDSESLIMALQDDLAISAGSACTSATVETSHVLSAMGVSDREAHESLRFSFGRFVLDSAIDRAVLSITHHVKKLRAMSPL